MAGRLLDSILYTTSFMLQEALLLITHDLLHMPGAGLVNIRVTADFTLTF